MRTAIVILAVVVVQITNLATAQVIPLSMESSSQGCCSAEIFLRTNSAIDVYIDGEFDREVTPTDDPCPPMTSDFNWAANTEGDPDDVTCDPYAVLQPGIFHSLRFGSVDLGFYSCVNSPDNFYCPFGDGSSDSILDIDEFGIRVTSDEHRFHVVEYQSTFSGGSWLLPHHGHEYCHRYWEAETDTLSTCLTRIEDIGYFYSNNIDSTFDLTDANIYVASGADWRFNDVVFNFHEDTGIVVEGRLRVDETAELNFEEDSDPFAAGIAIADGGHVDIDGASIAGGDLRMETSTTSELNFSGESYIAFDSMFVSGDVSFASGSATTFDGTILNRPEGDTVVVPNGATIYMDGSEQNPTRLLVDGYLESEFGSTINFAGEFAEIIGEEGVGGTAIR